MNKTNYHQITQELSEFAHNPKLLAVTKYSNIEQINEAITEGVKMIGENRIESAIEKFQGHSLSLGGRAREGVKKVEKHFIGTLQTKKLRKIVELFDVVESIGNIKQLQKVESIGKDIQRKIRIFLQFNISGEEQKSGFDESEIPQILEVAQTLEYTKIEGIMGMASQSDEDTVRKQFKHARDIFEKLKKELPDMQELSIGMSNDYHIALEEGATLVRIGSKIFQ